VNELDKLKLQLKNLKDKGHEEFSINVNYLLNILENLPKQSPLPKRSNVDWVDGGNFADE
jgi:hypothetical protein|tara:strand:+ start:183 stop:362 length:180 start_codon:yes stop_codon:yes gene_type:complete